MQLEPIVPEQAANLRLVFENFALRSVDSALKLARHEQFVAVEQKIHYGKFVLEVACKPIVDTHNKSLLCVGFQVSLLYDER